MSQPAPPTPPLTASFRDPAGSLFRYQGRVLRVVNEIGVADLDAFLASKAGQKQMASGAVVRTRALDAAECRELLAELEGVEGVASASLYHREEDESEI